MTCSVHVLTLLLLVLAVEPLLLAEGLPVLVLSAAASLVVLALQPVTNAVDPTTLPVTAKLRL